MKNTLLILGLLTICSKSLAQTTYTTATYGNWDDPAHWVGGVVPPNTIGTGDVVNINHNIYMSAKNLINNGTIKVTASAAYQDGSTITNNGKIIIVSETSSLSGTRNAGNFTNNYAIDNNGWMRQVKDFINNGYVFNQGRIYNFEKLFYDGVQMNCSDWGRFINNNTLCSAAGYVVNDCGSVTTGAPAITGCDALKSQIMNATLAVGETSKTDGLKLYPNPTTGVFTIGLENNDLNKAQVQIFDMTGKTITSKNTQKDNDALTIDISNVPKGNYVLKIKTSEGKEVIKKIIKQ